MKQLIKYSWLALLFLAVSCYEPLDINTDNVDKVNVPIKIATPLVDGNLVVNYDSLVNLDDLEGGFITFIDNKAYIKFDTIFDFYDQLSVFLGAADIDFGDATQFAQSFDMGMEATETPIQVVYYDNNGIARADEQVMISPQDSFEAQYNAKSIFLGIDQDAQLKIDGYDMDREMDLGLDFEIYKVELRSGKIEFSLSADNLPVIADDSLRIHPSFYYAAEDTTVTNEKAFYIASAQNQFPLGLKIKLNLAVGNVYTATGDTFKHEFTISTFDTTLSVDLTGNYFASDNGENKVDVKISNWMEIDAEAQKVIVPLPDKMNIEAGLSDLKFQQVQFNYGRDSMFARALDFDFDIIEMLPDDIEDMFEDDISIDGFYLKDPNIKIKLKSNLGFPAQFAIDNMQFETSGSPEFITNDGTAKLNLNQAVNPNSITTPIVALEDSLVIDSTTSRVSDIDLYDIKGVHLDYAVILNPEDKGHLPGQHNFIYLYDEDVREDMYDVVLAASAEIPIAFRFNNITLESTQELDLGTENTDMLELTEDDSLSLKVKLWTTNFPFDIATQFYFGKKGENDNLEIMDSMFNSEQILIPSSINGIQDSTSWSITINKSRFDAIQSMDSIKLKVRFAMDDDDFYHIEKGSSLGVGYKFSIAPSSATINIE